MVEEAIMNAIVVNPNSQGLPDYKPLSARRHLTELAYVLLAKAMSADILPKEDLVLILERLNRSQQSLLQKMSEQIKRLQYESSTSKRRDFSSENKVARSVEAQELGSLASRNQQVRTAKSPSFQDLDNLLFQEEHLVIRTESQQNTNHVEKISAKPEKCQSFESPDRSKQPDRLEITED